MRRKIYILILICFIGTQWSKAQESLVTLGPAYSLPAGEYKEHAEFGVGLVTRFEFGVTENLSAGFGIEFHYFQNTRADLIDRVEAEDFSLFLPSKGFLKYAIIEQRKGPYIALNMGTYPILSVQRDIHSSSNTKFDVDFGWGPEVGVYVLEQVGFAFSCDIFYHNFQDDKGFNEPMTFLSFRSFVSF